MQYDHKRHAGNAGDVWKHFILTEVLERLLAKGEVQAYIESHLGYPEYSLDSPGEWSGGIGRCWHRLQLLEEFCLFSMLEETNGCMLNTYLGSASLALRLAERCSVPLIAEGWDTHPGVAAAWSVRPQLRFHQGDGFSGARDLIDRGLIDSSKHALLLIDPPYVEEGEMKKAAGLMDAAVEAGWTVLWWQMIGAETLSETRSCREMFSLNFEEAGMEGGRWAGATVAMAGANPDLVEHVRMRASDFLNSMKS